MSEALKSRVSCHKIKRQIENYYRAMPATAYNPLQFDLINIKF